MYYPYKSYDNGKKYLRCARGAPNQRLLMGSIDDALMAGPFLYYLDIIRA